jgi:membrane protein
MMRTAWVITKQTWKGYHGDQAAQHAAAIAYYALFSLVPIAIVTVFVLGIVFADEGRRADLVDAILDNVPLTQTEGRDEVENAIREVRRVSGPAAVAGVLGLLWTSSAMFSSIRRALNRVWDVDESRPWFQGKLVDFAQVGLLSAILLASIVLTVALRTLREASADWIGPLSGDNPLWEVAFVALPAAISFVTFALLYRLVPAARPRWRDVLPGAAFATVLFEALKTSFALYVANFNNFDVVYGSLAGVLLFLLYTYLSACILIAGAELSRVLARYHAGELESEIHPPVPQPSIAEQALRALRGLFVRQ